MENLDDFNQKIRKKFTVISGPCVIENEQHALQSAEILQSICERHNVHFVYKSSFDKANRSSIDSYRGPGLDKGLRILEKVKKICNVPILTDIHLPSQAEAAAEVCDIIQIPAFLCRQTDLLIAAAQTNVWINIKKAQFMSPPEMVNVIKKLKKTGSEKIILTERGSSFGYNNLVADMRSIPIMKQFGCPVCFDASHSVQLPGAQGTSSGGQREFIPTLAKAAVVSGADMLFIESHNDPDKALSDKYSVMPFQILEKLIAQTKALHELISSWSPQC